MTKLTAAFCNFVNAPKKNALWRDHVCLSVLLFECDLVFANKLRLISAWMGVWSPLQDRCLASMSYRKIGEVTVILYLKAQMSFYPQLSACLGLYLCHQCWRAEYKPYFTERRKLNFACTLYIFHPIWVKWSTAALYDLPQVSSKSLHWKPKFTQ